MYMSTTTDRSNERNCLFGHVARLGMTDRLIKLFGARSASVLSPVHTSNISKQLTGNFVACCFDIVATNGNNVEAALDFVEATF